MFTDPTTLFALALCIGILGLLVLILPLLLLFWSQMEPQFAGAMGGGANSEEDEYSSQAVLPRLMKSFDDIAERNQISAGRKPKSSSAGTRKATTGSRSKASTRAKTVKAAPASKSTKPKAKAKAKTKAAAKKAVPKSAKATKTAAAKQKSTTSAAGKTKAKSATKPKSKSAGAGVAAKKAKPARRAPAGAKRDPILGLVYSKQPKEVDDLKQIKGVAKVIEGKLHKAGIYTFRQVAEWDGTAIDAISDQLSFKGRIRNEDWQKQCAKFHQEKYGEKLG